LFPTYLDLIFSPLQYRFTANEWINSKKTKLELAPDSAQTPATSSAANKGKYKKTNTDYKKNCYSN
jgi:hypothetical protein